MAKALLILGLLLIYLLSGPVFSQEVAESVTTPSKDVLSIQVTPSEGVWVGTNEGVFYLDPGGTVYYHLVGPVEAGDYWYVSGTTTDVAGMTWVASADGVYLSQPGQQGFEPIVKGVLASTITVDVANTVWAGTMGHGIVKIINEKPTTWFGITDGLPSDYVLATFTSSDGRIWAGTTEGLAILKNTVWQASPAFKEHIVFSMTEHFGKLAVGTDDGAYFSEDRGVQWAKLQGTEGKVVTEVQGFRNDMIIGTKDHGVLVYPMENLSASPLSLSNKDLGFSDGVIKSIAEKGNKILLFGSFGGGVKAFSAKKWESLKQLAFSRTTDIPPHEQ